MYKKKLLPLMVAALLPFSAILNAEEAPHEASSGLSKVEPQATENFQSAETSITEVAVDEVATMEAQATSDQDQSDVVTSQAVDSAEATEVTVGDVAAMEEQAAPDQDQSDTATSQTVEPVESGGGNESSEASSEVQAEAAVEENTSEDIFAQRLKAREQRYQVLRQRAEEAGVMLPERAPWHSSQMDSFRPDMQERMQHHQKMMNMSPEERDAFRLERYQEMREKAQQQGVEMPETPPWQARKQAMDDEWAKHQAVIEGMSDEERAACHAMHRRHMGMGSYRGMGPVHGAGCGGCQQAPQGNYGGGAPMPMPRYPGYGYGPAPAPYGQGNFWDPNY
jgi:hypothetical protein